jgi:competence protein ComEC
VIVLGAVIMNRRALTMRNLAFAVLAVVAIEPEAILGVSFQLSFAAVAALVAVMEARIAAHDLDPDPFVPKRGEGPKRGTLAAHLVDRPLALLFATAFATLATASFMAYHFHDLSPYVLIGNPLTLTVIEFFAVPGALIGAALYPLGLDGPVWLYVGAGIKFILWVARFIADAPGSTLHLRAFAPYALPFLALGVMSAAIWRTWTFRLSAVPLALIGLIGATHGPRYDVIVAPSGDLAAARSRASTRSRRALRPPRLRRRLAGGRVAFDRLRSPRVRRGLRAGGDRGQRAERAPRLQSEIRARRNGARAARRRRPDVERRQGLRARERPQRG